MPRLGASKLKRVILPSTKGSGDEAWVDLDLEVAVGTLIDVQDKPAQTQSVVILMRAIKAWNFTDESNKPLEISEENVRKVKVTDFVALTEEFDLAPKGLSASKKKR